MESVIKARVYGANSRRICRWSIVLPENGGSEAPFTTTDEKVERIGRRVIARNRSSGNHHAFHVICLQTEIAKRLNAIIAQVLPFLAQEVSL